MSKSKRTCGQCRDTMKLCLVMACAIAIVSFSVAKIGGTESDQPTQQRSEQHGSVENQTPVQSGTYLDGYLLRVDGQSGQAGQPVSKQRSYCILTKVMAGEKPKISPANSISIPAPTCKEFALAVIRAAMEYPEFRKQIEAIEDM